MNTRCQSDPVARVLLAEFIGSAMLVAIVVGSGIAAERLSPDDVGLQHSRIRPQQLSVSPF